MPDESHTTKELNLDAMPVEELELLAGQVMLVVPQSPRADDLIGAIKRRVQMIDQLDRDALMEIVIWARRPVSRSADNRELVREISQIHFVSYNGLGCDALLALAKLRSVPIGDDVTETSVRAALKRHDGISGWVERKKRRFIAKVLGTILDTDEGPGEYQYLPEKKHDESLQRTIEQQGVVGGVASKLKVAADDYIGHKLDEIEDRIDRKLDQIDLRLSEWRDREIVNRLRIVKITLIGSIIVAALSLLYNYIRGLS